jgi:hypothetical protein
MNLFRLLFMGFHRFSGGAYGMRPRGMMMGSMMGPMMGRQGGFGRRAFMYGSDHGGGFHMFGFLLFFIILVVMVVLVLRWLRRKSKDSSLKQLIDTPFVSSHTPISGLNGSILDDWEKSVMKEKENEKHGDF